MPIFGEITNFPKSTRKIVVYAPMLQEGIIWKNIHPWKFPFYCSLNIFQIGANCKNFDDTNQTECPITGVYIFLGFKIFLNKSYGIKKIIPSYKNCDFLGKKGFYGEKIIEIL